MSDTQDYSVHVLFDGYSSMNDEGTTMEANCSCTLIKGPENIIVDTMTPWSGVKILQALKEHDICPENISYVISTHGHSDHTGNNNLFLNAKHIVGFSISHKETYFIHPFENGTPFIINDNIRIIPTPGYTLSDVTVIVRTGDNVTYAIAGDLFEHRNDINNPKLWLDSGSESPELQRRNRLFVAQVADWIIPGHGPVFKCTEEIRQTLSSQI